MEGRYRDEEVRWKISENGNEKAEDIEEGIWREEKMGMRVGGRESIKGGGEQGETFGNGGG